MSRSYSKLWKLVVIPAWVAAGFFTAAFLVTGLARLLVFFGVPLGSMNEAVLNSTFAAFLYIVSLGLVIGIPWLAKNRRVSLADLGFKGLPTWTDIFVTPAAFVIYLILSSLLILLASKIWPGFDLDQVQDVGFEQLSKNFEYFLAFFTLVVIAPVAEETLFRGYMYGKLRNSFPTWASALVTSLLFGILHGNPNLMVDTFALSIILCTLRESTGSLWAPVLLHMTKNGIAFYILFINPILLTTLGG